MMLKKILAFICALFLLSAAGCGNSISEKKDLKDNYSEHSPESTETIDINSKDSDDAFSDTENTEEEIGKIILKITQLYFNIFPN